MSFPLLQDYIAKLEEDREVELFALAFLFKGLRDEKNESWNHLADRFFKVYSDELYRCCGYEMELRGLPGYGWHVLTCLWSIWGR